METITNKEVKKFILENNDLEKIPEYLELDYGESIIGIFNAIYILAKHYDKNKNTIKNLIFILENSYQEKISNELKLLIHQIINFQNKISDWKTKDKIKIKEISSKFQIIFLEIQKILINNDKEKNKCLEYIIFYDKNLSTIKKILKNNSYHLNLSFKQDNIFSKVIQEFITLSDFDEVHYLYHVILTFLNSRYGEDILKDKEKYLNMIKNTDNKEEEQVNKILDLLNLEDTITIEDLEQQYDINFHFPEVILNEINLFQDKDLPRRDFTNIESITIDGENARCLDDALSISTNKDGTYNLYIHITDIPTLIPFTSLTREEASFRVESLYLYDTNIPLYPNSISYHKCSLNSGNIKNTITYSFQLDPNFRVIPNSFKIELGKIKVTHCFTYDEADARMNHPQKDNLDILLMTLVEFARLQRNETKKKELYREYENTFHFKDSHESLYIDSSPSANIIHESMILANYSVGKYFKELGFPYIYRMINIPSSSFMEEQLQKMKQVNEKIIQNKDFINILKDSYIKSLYSKEPVYHLGLGLECYSHSTSPGRRYMDSLGQYIIHDLLIQKNIIDSNLKKWEYHIDKAIEYSNKRIKQNELFAREYNYLSYKKLKKEKK